MTHPLKLNKKGEIKSSEKKLQRKIPQQKKKKGRGRYNIVILTQLPIPLSPLTLLPFNAKDTAMAQTTKVQYGACAKPMGGATLLAQTWQ